MYYPTNQVRVACISAEIRAQQLANTSQKGNHLNQHVHYMTTTMVILLDNYYATAVLVVWAHIEGLKFDSRQRREQRWWFLLSSRNECNLLSNCKSVTSANPTEV